MINLIKNELFKIFKNGKLLIFIMVIFLFMILVNFLSSRDYSYNSYDYSYEISLLEESLKEDGLSDYEKAVIEAQIYSYSLSLNYSYDTWQNNYFLLFQEKIIESFLVGDTDFLENFESVIKNEEYEVYLNLEIENLESKLLSSEVSDKDIEFINYKIDMYNYWLVNDLGQNNYLEESIASVLNLKYEEIYYGENKSSEIEIYEYSIYNEEDVMGTNNFKTNIENFMNNYTQFIILFALVIASSILASEFKSGTIKSLLITPYKRSEILAAKFISAFVSVLIIIFSMFLFQIILSFVFFDIGKSIAPVVILNETTNAVVFENVFIYELKLIISFLPTIIFLMSLSFLITLLIPSSALGVCASFIIYLLGEMLNTYALFYNIDNLKYFITLNWDFTSYIYGGKSIFEFLSFNFSIVIYVFYLSLIWLICIKLFNRKYISNE